MGTSPAQIIRKSQDLRQLGGVLGAEIAADAANSRAKKKKVKYFIDPLTGGFYKTVLEADAR